MLNQGRIAPLVLMAMLAASETRAQEPATPKTESSVAVDSLSSGKPSVDLPRQEHRFWDKKNDWLFAGVGAARTFDYFSTLNMRRRGDQEILVSNDLVDSHAAFAVVEAAGTGVSIGASCGLRSCISDWRRRARCATTVSKRHIPGPLRSRERRAQGGNARSFPPSKSTG